MHNKDNKGNLLGKKKEAGSIENNRKVGEVSAATETSPFRVLKRPAVGRRSQLLAPMSAQLVPLVLRRKS